MMENIITNIFAKLALVAGLTFAFNGNAWADDVVVTLDNIGANLSSTANTTIATTNITATETANVYTLNYYQCKKQGNAMLMTKNVNPLISNKTEMPGNIKSVEVFINSGAAAKTTYDCAFSTTEVTSATSGIGAVNITGGNSHVYSNMTGASINVAGKYFCITLGNANNGQVLKLVITCESTGSGASLTANDLTLNATSKSFDLKDGDNQTFQLTNSGSADGALSYESSNENVATVSSEGLITALSEGSATITVTQAQTATYYGGTATCSVTVTDSRYSVSDLTFTAACGGSGTADDGAEWTVTSNANESTFADDGIHYGTNSANVTYVQLSTSDISGTIRKVVVKARDAQATATISVTVGGVAFTCSGSATATNTSADYTFTGSGNGEIIVRIDRGSSMSKAIYVKSVKVSYIAGPSISADGVNIAYNATDGSITYTINNEPNPAGAISASTTSDWITLGSETASPISFTCLANPLGNERTATVTLTYTYNTNETVTKDVTVTQDAAPAVPGISASDVDIAYSATNGSIDFTVNNPVDGGTVSASTEAAWLTAGEAVSTSPISFTCSANSENTERSATVTLTYTYNTNQTVTTNVTVTQAAAPVIYTTIPDLFNVATGTATSVNITFNSWVVSAVKNSNAYITDNEGHGLIVYNSNHGFAVNDVLTGTVTCKVQLYRGSAELTEFSSSTSGLTVVSNGTVTPQTIAISNLGGVNTGALLTFEGLTYNGSALVDQNSNSITPYTTLYNYGEAFKNGKSYDVGGIYLQYNDTKEVLPRSADDIEEYVSAEPSITVAPATVNAPADGASGTITVTYNNITTVAAEVVFYTSSAATDPATAPAWITAEINTDNNLEYLIKKNTTEEVRAAYLKVWAYDDNMNEVYSDIITINQAIPVVDYAELPFEYDGNGTGTLPTGLTVSGTGTYDSSPKIKFDSTGDYVILKINEEPGTLTFDIKGNSFSGGTFKVQTSADGTNYSDLKSYTSLGNTQSEVFEDLASSVRYIKWIYTIKSSGNVGLGNITLAEYVEPSSGPSITVTPNTASHAASDGSESLTLTYENLEISDASDFAVQFCDAKGAAITAEDEPSWIVAIVEEQNSSYVVSIVIDANESDERSAYFKVYALGNTDYVYSNLVTITQAEFVPDYAVLPFTWNSGYSSTPTGISIAGSVTPKTNYLNFTESEASVIIKINDRPGALSYDLKGNPSSGTATSGTFKVQASVNGTDYVDLKEYIDINNQTHSECIAALPNNIRYIKWVYTNKESGNVALSNISLDEFSPDAEIITLSAALNGGRYWATFYNENNRYDLPEGAQAFTMNGSKNLYLLGTGSVIPANTAVIIIADHADIVLTKGEPTTVEVSGTSNSLVGSNSPVAVSGISGTPYVMGVVGGVIGFYPFSGANIPAFKAYYVK